MKSKISHQPLKTPVSPPSLTRSLEGLSLQNLTQSTPNQARMGESSINHEKALTLDEFLSHKGWPWRGSPSLPDLASCHPQVSVPQNMIKTSCTRFSWPSIQSCSPFHHPTSRSCPGRQLKRARGDRAGPGPRPALWTPMFPHVKQGLESEKQ